MALVRQALIRRALPDIDDAVRRAIEACPALRHARPGARVAVGVGSRGIRDIDRVVVRMILCLKDKGLIPNIIGQNDDITRFEYLKKTNKNFGSVLIVIELQNPTDIQNILKKMDEHNFEYVKIEEEDMLYSYLI